MYGTHFRYFRQPKFSSLNAAAATGLVNGTTRPAGDIFLKGGYPANFILDSDRRPPAPPAHVKIHAKLSRTQEPDPTGLRGPQELLGQVY